MNTKQPSDGARVSPAEKLRIIEIKLTEGFDQWIETVPRGCSGDRLFRLFIFALKENPALVDCSRETIFKAFRDCVATGLDVGGERAPAYLTASKGRLKYHVSYRGFLELAHRAGQVKTFRIEAVREGDLFQYTPSAADPVLHTWSDDADRELLAVSNVYAQLVKPGGGVECEVWSTARIEKHKEQFVSNWSSPSSNWSKDWLSMAKKTVILSLLRSGRVYLSNDIRENLEP